MTHISKPQTAKDRFVQALAPGDIAFLRELLATSRQTADVELLPWRIGTQFVGYLLPDTALALLSVMPLCSRTEDTLVWDAQDWNESERSGALQDTLQAMRAAGLIKGWRDERFAFWSSDTWAPQPETPPLFAVERAGFRPLGLLSHAVHINGYAVDGTLWCGRRSLHKATDPGMLDNVTAGGLPLDESILECAMRELWEEAGLRHIAPGDLHNAGFVRVSRPDLCGWHDEVLHVFNLTLPLSTVPVNQDGEVSDFLRLAPRDVMEQLRNHEFTVDAAVSLAHGLGLGQAFGYNV